METVAAAQAIDIDDAVVAARRAFADWRDLEPASFGRLVHRVGP
ncbi:hypothetical protein [Natrinema zhouii]